MIVITSFAKLTSAFVHLESHPVFEIPFIFDHQIDKYTSQRIGINMYPTIGRQVATFLKLPTPEKYSGYILRRSFATKLVGVSGDITAFKRHGGLKSTTVAESYIDDCQK